MKRVKGSSLLFSWHCAFFRFFYFNKIYLRFLSYFNFRIRFFKPKSLSFFSALLLFGKKSFSLDIFDVCSERKHFSRKRVAPSDFLANSFPQQMLRNSRFFSQIPNLERKIAEPLRPLLKLLFKSKNRNRT